MITILTSDLDDMLATLKTIIPISGSEELESTTIYIGQICGESIIFADMSWQKVEIAKTIAEINSHSPITSLIGASTTASVIPCEAPIGTIAICRDTIQYDLDYTDLGYPVGYINLLEKVILKSNANLIKLAQKAACKHDFCSVLGRFISADRFMASNLVSANLKKKYNTQFIDCNSSPVLEMGAFYNVPSILIAGVADYGDNKAVTDYNHNREYAGTDALETAITMAYYLIKKKEDY